MKKPLFEMLIPKRPVSLQAKNRDNLKIWKDYVYGRARREWHGGLPLQDSDLRLSLVYICDDFPADIDNIIKPIQDALIGVVFADDSLISDVDCHRRFLTDTIDMTHLPGILIRAILSGEECICVRVGRAENLEVYL